MAEPSGVASTASHPGTHASCSLCAGLGGGVAGKTRPSESTKPVKSFPRRQLGAASQPGPCSEGCALVTTLCAPQKGPGPRLPVQR